MHLPGTRALLTVWLLLALVLPTLASAQQATPVPEFDVAEAIPPLQLYDTLLTTPLPDDLLPEDILPLQAYGWRDSNDPDLDGSIGGIIYADLDPFGSQLPASITYLIYPDASGPLKQLGTVTRYGEDAELPFDGRTVPAGVADLGGLVGHFIAVDNVLIYGMVPLDAGDAEDAAALTAAGLQHLVQLTADAAPLATPVSATAREAEDALLAVAAAPFPDDRLPFETGPLVVLPMPLSGAESENGLVGALLVRDADRDYRYPLATYHFYSRPPAADEAVAEAVSNAGVATPVALPSDIDILYPTDIIHRANDATSVVVRVGPTTVTVDVSQGDREERRATALQLAEIAVDHLIDVTD